MTEEQFKKILEEQQEHDAPFSLLAQLRFSFEMSVPDEMYKLLIGTKEFETREWIRLSFMDGIPMEELRKFPEMDKTQIRETRRNYIYKKEGIREQKELEVEMNKKLQKLQLLVEQSKPMERYLEVILKQKDTLIENYRLQVMQVKEQNAMLTEELKEETTQIKELQQELMRTGLDREKAKEIICGENDVKYPAVVSREDRTEAFTVVKGKHKWFRWRQRRQRKRQDAAAEYLKNPNWTSEQMVFVIECLEEGMRLDDIKKISSPKISVERMRMLKRVLEVKKG